MGDWFFIVLYIGFGVFILYALIQAIKEWKNGRRF